VVRHRDRRPALELRVTALCNDVVDVAGKWKPQEQVRPVGQLGSRRQLHAFARCHAERNSPVKSPRSPTVMPPNSSHDAIVASSDVSAAATRDGTWMREISRRRCARVIDPPGRGSLDPWAATAIGLRGGQPNGQGHIAV
jgi:hypothetical protein